jgi:hypothetical protein
VIVGLVGFIGSGKGTAGDILVSHGFRRDSFAGPVKDAVAVIFGWDRALLEGDTDTSRKFREIPCPFWSEVMGRDYTPREALQKMGTEAGRNVFCSDIWTRALEQRISAATAVNDLVNFVITDVRFPNEAKLIRELGGYVVEVTRGTRPEWYDYAESLNEANDWNGKVQVMDRYPNIHYSEWAWIGSPEITHVIENNGTLKDLEDNLTKFLGM